MTNARKAGIVLSRGGKFLRTFTALTALTIALAAYLAPAASAQELDLELVLLADATGSIDADEIRFQRKGYADAITDPMVLSAIRNGAYGKIAVTYVEWGDFDSQDVVVGWRIIDSLASAEAFAAALLTPPRRAFGRNAIGAALLKGKALIEGNGIEGVRRVIDLSADSANNWNGQTIEAARAEVLASRIVINGLAVLCRHCSGRPAAYNLEDAFAARIIGGPGSFVVTADSSATFADAVRKKLILEISGTVPITTFSRAEFRVAPYSSLAGNPGARRSVCSTSSSNFTICVD